MKRIHVTPASPPLTPQSRQNSVGRRKLDTREDAWSSRPAAEEALEELHSQNPKREENEEKQPKHICEHFKACDEETRQHGNLGKELVCADHDAGRPQQSHDADDGARVVNVSSRKQVEQPHDEAGQVDAVPPCMEQISVNVAHTRRRCTPLAV